MPPSAPRAPLDRWPVQYFDSELGFAWYVREPNVFVNQVLVAKADEAAAHWVHDRVDELLRFEEADVLKGGGMAIVHDWRMIDSYTPAARKAFMGRMKRRRNGYLRSATVVLKPSPSPFFGMAIEAANLFTAIAMSRKVELSHNLDDALRKVGVTTPPTETVFPSRLSF